ncbi:MAG: hypothetical protein Q8M03_00670 [Legionella sp.]|nr:hypothetical protein [Legionella sp.]
MFPKVMRRAVFAAPLALIAVPAHSQEIENQLTIVTSFSKDFARPKTAQDEDQIAPIKMVLKKISTFNLDAMGAGAAGK